METRSGRVPAATPAPPPSPEPATCQTAQVRVAVTPLAKNKNPSTMVEVQERTCWSDRLLISSLRRYWRRFQDGGYWSEPVSRNRWVQRHRALRYWWGSCPVLFFLQTIPCPHAPPLSKAAQTTWQPRSLTQLAFLALRLKMWGRWGSSTCRRSLAPLFHVWYWSSQLKHDLQLNITPCQKMSNDWALAFSLGMWIFRFLVILFLEVTSQSKIDSQFKWFLIQKLIPCIIYEQFDKSWNQNGTVC